MQKTISILALSCLIVLIAAQTSISETTAINNAAINNATIRGGGAVPDWIVEGATDGNYNGNYYNAGTQNGDPYYTYAGGGGTRYLYRATTPAGGWDVWRLNNALQADGTGPADAAYYGTFDFPLPAIPWSLGTATGDVPTVRSGQQ